MDKTLILKGLMSFETTEYTEYTERKRRKRLKWKLREPLILKGFRRFETTGWLRHGSDVWVGRCCEQDCVGFNTRNARMRRAFRNTRLRPRKANASEKHVLQKSHGLIRSYVYKRYT